jgi:ferredoxin-NADP reductase
VTQSSDAPTPGRKRGITVHIIAKREIAQDIHFFDLQLPEGGMLPEFTAGAHIPVRIPNGRMRSYSLCNDPTERHRYCLAATCSRSLVGRQVVCLSQAALALPPSAR